MQVYSSDPRVKLYIVLLLDFFFFQLYSVVNSFSTQYYIVGINTKVKVPFLKCLNSSFSSFLKNLFSAYYTVMDTRETEENIPGFSRQELLAQAGRQTCKGVGASWNCLCLQV